MLAAGSRDVVVLVAGSRGADVWMDGSRGSTVLVVGCSSGVEVLVARFAELKTKVGRGVLVPSSCISGLNKRDSSGQRTDRRASAHDIETTG